MISTQSLLAIAGVDSRHLYDVYDYGSRVYGTHDKDSDYDFIMVVHDYEEGSGQIESGNVTINLYSYDVWQQKINDHHIDALECESQGIDDEVLDIDLAKLRSSISRTASNSWVKCKKKLTVEEDARRIGIKSLFHSFRIPMFGIQIAKTGAVRDFKEANALWEEMKPLLTNNATWDEINAMYKKRHNELMSEFRKYAEKT